ncbi:hypothetical protein KIM372_09400 [Bombiscardovia nodaiensis]|uniref:Glycerol transporter n=1 Tax=Bombiscardovia nodaiensis TaxID=2932181 RepID=A0ABM8B821_9BIFI|nr:hypothetical protein KIM372_09400 [Bombiscardovia nodaiensis]
MNTDTDMSSLQVLPPVARGALRVGAEFAGTFLMCFAVYSASSLGRIYTSFSPAVIALVWVFSVVAAGSLFGKISGVHFNPAVTFAAMFTTRIGWIEGICYMLGQFLGAIGAGAALVYLLPMNKNNDGNAWLPGAVNGFDKGSPTSSVMGRAGLSFNVTVAIVVELVASIIVVGVALSSLQETGKPERGHIWNTALAYGAGALIAYPVTGAGMNPARSTGIALFASGKGLEADPIQQLLIFWICPFLAAAIVGLVSILYHMLLDAAQTRIDTAPESAIEMPEALLNPQDDGLATVQTAQISDLNEPALGTDENHELARQEETLEEPLSQQEGEVGSLRAEAADSSEEPEDTHVGQQKADTQAQADTAVESD